MKIERKIIVPTGEIYIGKGEKGLIEFLTVGDYGKGYWESNPLGYAYEFELVK